jgi:hypothetical protein
MKSHEVLKQSVEDMGVKTIASDLGVSPSLLYKWCQPGDEQIISWLCQKADGFYYPNPSADKNPTKDLFSHTQKLVREFSDLLQVVSESNRDDSKICEEDSLKIRKEWEELKGVGESFVHACEKGFFLEK